MGMSRGDWFDADLDLATFHGAVKLLSDSGKVCRVSLAQFGADDRADSKAADCEASEEGRKDHRAIVFLGNPSRIATVSQDIAGM